MTSTTAEGLFRPGAHECDPAAVGVRTDLLDRAVQLVAERCISSRLVVRRHGVTVLDRSAGCRPDDLFWTFSVSKPYTAVTIHRLAEQRVIDLDEPVATYWPEFGRHGKDAVTVRQVLRHRTGFATAAGSAIDALAMTNWAAMIRLIEAARPRWAPGTAPAYQFLIFGFILGEVARRATGSPIGRLVHELIVRPLAGVDTWLGVPEDRLDRCVPLRTPGPEGVVMNAAINTRRVRTAAIPSGGLSTTATELADFYQALLADLDGANTLIGAEALRSAVQVTSEDEVDRYIHLPVRWSEGFQLGGERSAGTVSPMGRTTSRRAFGHNGSNCCVAWADPERDLVFCYLGDRFGHRAADLRHHQTVADLVVAACE